MASVTGPRYCCSPSMKYQAAASERLGRRGCCCSDAAILLCQPSFVHDRQTDPPRHEGIGRYSLQYPLSSTGSPRGYKNCQAPVQSSSYPPLGSRSARGTVRLCEFETASKQGRRPVKPAGDGWEWLGTLCNAGDGWGCPGMAGDHWGDINRFNISCYFHSSSQFACKHELSPHSAAAD